MVDKLKAMIPKAHPHFGASELLAALLPGASRRTFEEEVAARSGARHGLSFAYAHAGFWALLKALGLRGAEVILPAYTCDIMPEVVVATGNVPVFVDISLADYNMDLGALKSAITGQTRAIVATHMFGYPADVDAVREVARAAAPQAARRLPSELVSPPPTTAGEGILIVEDAALVFPGAMASMGGLRGDVGLFSFGPGKPLFTLRGGVAVTNHDDLAERLRAWRDREMNSLPGREWLKRWALLVTHALWSRRAIYGLAWRLNLSKGALANLHLRPAETVRPQPQPGASLPGDYAVRYADLQARIGLSQLRKADAILAQRREMASLYGELLRAIPGLVPAPIVEGASYALYAARVRDRDQIGFFQHMRIKGVEVGRTFNYALPGQEKYRPYVRGCYPCAEQTGREIVNLPIYAGLTEREVRYVAESVRQVLKGDLL